ncbi:MAG: YdeI/OmpD-associated family protein [Betaproteobacteria bacterium]|nr:YdeI/OmpD-associated family protein [Betaproteobacteria bacterium]
MPASTRNNEPILQFSNAAELEAHMASPGAGPFWLQLGKAGAGKVTCSKEAAIEAALCCGWIDGQLAGFDQDYFLVRMTPRRPGSRWSANNRATAERLREAGRLRPTGLAEVEAAKADGRWDAAYASQSQAQVPPDLEAALAANKAARRFFEQLDRGNRFSIIYRVNDAKKPETRARRIANFVEMLARGEALHPSGTSKRVSATTGEQPDGEAKPGQDRVKARR